MCRLKIDHGFHRPKFLRVANAKFDRFATLHCRDHKSVTMRAQQPARIARVKKLSRSQGQQILREDEIDSDEYDSLHNQPNKVTSGVEAAEVCAYRPAK